MHFTSNVHTDVTTNDVTQLRGHKNLKNRESYKTAYDQQRMSYVLTRLNDSLAVPSASCSHSNITESLMKFDAKSFVDSKVSGLFFGSSSQSSEISPGDD